MIGRLDSTTQEVAIVGAGISGLLSAYYLDQAGWNVTLIEAKSEAGGLLGTKKTGNGIVENAAHSIPATPTVLKLFQELGVRLLPINANSKARYVFKKHRLKKVPLSIIQILGAFLRAYFRLAPKKDPEKLTLGEWARHFLGKPACTFLMSPFTRGIFGADPDELSVSAAFPMLCIPRGHSLISFLLANKFRKNPPNAIRRRRVVIPRGPISAPENGMGEWTQALIDHLSKRLGARFQRSRSVNSLDELSEFKNLILTVPAQEAARLIRPEDLELSKALDQVKYSPLVSATIFVRTQDFSKSPQGLGVLIPQSEKHHCLGILFNSSAFQNRVSSNSVGASTLLTTSLTMMLGGTSNPGLLSESDAGLLEIIKTELRAILNFHGEPINVLIHRWPKAIPQYNENLLNTWSLAEQSWCSKPGRILFGNYTGQVSLRGMVELASHLH